MNKETNLRCKCGNELYKVENMRHTYYICIECRNIYAIRGEEHFMHVDEIDIITGKIYLYNYKKGCNDII